MADAAVAANLDQSLDVQGGVSSQVALNNEMFVDVFTQQRNLVLGQIFHTGIGVHACGF